MNQGMWAPPQSLRETWPERPLWALSTLVVVVGFVFMPAEIYPGDPMTMREETRAILLHGELAVEDVVARSYRTVGEVGQYVVDNPRNDRSYSKYGSMAAWMYLLPMSAELLIEGELPPFSSPRRVVYLNIFNIALAVLVAASLYRTARRFDATGWVAAGFVTLCFYTTYLWNYLRAQNSEIMQLLFWHSLGNRFLTLLSNMLNDTNWSDMETCYKAFTAEALRAMPLFANRFGIEPEIAAKVARNRFRMYEVPITYHGRSYEDGKKIGWQDGIAALWFIFKYRFFSRYCDAGKATLDALEQAPQFNRWMYQVVAGFLGERVVELGSGKGNLSKFIASRRTVLLADKRDDYCRHLQQRWANHPNVAVSNLDMTRPEDYAAIKDFDPDSVVFLNVLEHIEDDRAVLRNLFAATSSGCRQVILVPFDMKLFSSIDEDLGHFRRYGLGELEDKLREAGFLVERQFYFNKPGRLAWYVFNTVGGQRALTPMQLRLYSFLTPIFRVWDRIVPGMGLSTVVVARKP